MCPAFPAAASLSCLSFQEDEILRQSALRLISVIGYSLSLVSLTLATLLMGILRLVARGEGGGLLMLMKITFLKVSDTFAII